MSQPSPSREEGNKKNVRNIKIEKSVASEDDEKPKIDPKDEYVDFPKPKQSKATYDTNQDDSEEDVVINYSKPKPRRTLRRRAKDRVDFKAHNEALRQMDASAADDMDDSSDEFDKDDD